MLSHLKTLKNSKFSDACRRKMSLAKMGKPRSIETRRKIGLSNSGKIRSTDMIRQMSLRVKGEKNPMFGTQGAWTGKKHSEKTKNKIREAVTRYMLTHPRKFNKETKIEHIIANELTTSRIDYIPQHHIKTTRFSVDFFIPSANLVIECDGCRYHACKKCGHTYFKDRITRDRLREAILKKLGYRIIRFWEHDIVSSLPKCIKLMHRAINQK